MEINGKKRPIRNPPTRAERANHEHIQRSWERLEFRQRAAARGIKYHTHMHRKQKGCVLSWAILVLLTSGYGYVTVRLVEWMI